jgi:putative membrane protein
MKYIILAIKGFFMGIANIIPGVSGGTIALILGIYEELVDRVSNLFKNFVDNLKFIIPIVVGILASIVIMSGVIKSSYDNFPLPTMMFFVGLVLGGIPMLYGKVKGQKTTKKDKSINYLIFLLTFSLVIFMSLSDLIFQTSNTIDFKSLSLLGYVLVFIVGIIAAGTMVIPGISGSLVLMLLGYYYPIINAIHDLVKFKDVFSNIVVLGIFGVGVLIGIVVISKVLSILFKNYSTKTYYGVLGFVCASVIAIPISTILELGEIGYNIPLCIISVVTLVLGSIVSYKLGDR